MGLPQRDLQLHTYGDYLSWSDDVRYELIDGVAYLMSPAPPRLHQELAGELHRQIANALLGKRCRPFIAPVDVRLPKRNEANELVDTVVQPEVFVVCDPSKLDVRGVRGAPDWVIEILSPTTAGHDQTTKLETYERAGVREYWLVHPTDRTVVVYTLLDGDFGRPHIHEMNGTLASTVLPELMIDWATTHSS
ncbi:MAG: Uma2 family endonuclease [Kofleriaceae bacterium]|nr:Uma2 family endonuclease [Kofleriaceae bacterium]